VLLASNGAEHLAIGVVRGATPPAVPTPDMAPWVPLGPRGPRVRAYERLAQTEDVRRAANARRVAARLAAGARGTPWADLAEGLVLHLAATLAVFRMEEIAQDGEEPSVEVRSRLEAVRVSPRAHQRVLDEIVGSLGPPAERYCERAQGRKRFHEAGGELFAIVHD
jgi:hypothetical protein